MYVWCCSRCTINTGTLKSEITMLQNYLKFSKSILSNFLAKYRPVGENVGSRSTYTRCLLTKFTLTSHFIYQEKDPKNRRLFQNWTTIVDAGEGLWPSLPSYPQSGLSHHSLCREAKLKREREIWNLFLQFRYFRMNNIIGQNWTSWSKWGWVVVWLFLGTGEMGEGGFRRGGAELVLSIYPRWKRK